MIEHARIPFSDLIFLDDNPRTRTPEGLQSMADDIQADPTFFDNRPVLVNLTEGRHLVYAGDLRAHAAHDVLGWPDIPCNIERDLTTAQMRQRAIKDNLHRETWAPDILASYWADDDLATWGLTPDAWGADADAIDTHAGGFTASEDDYEPPADIQTDIVPGDLFEIGPHRLLCGDSINADDVAKVMGGEKANMVFTDPPYNINYGNIKHSKFRQREIKNDNMSASDFSEFCAGFVSNILLFNKGCVYVAGAPGVDGRIMFTECDKAMHCSTVVIWNKDQFTLGRGKYQNKYEPIWFGWVDTGNGFYGDRTQSNVWDIPRPKKADEHPTMKPVELVSRALNHASRKEDSVLDLFLGSGTTMVAAHQLHRRCFGLEIDPKYCQIILDRMLKLDPTLTITRNGKKYSA